MQEFPLPPSNPLGEVAKVFQLMVKRAPEKHQLALAFLLCATAVIIVALVVLGPRWSGAGTQGPAARPVPIEVHDSLLQPTAVLLRAPGNRLVGK